MSKKSINRKPIIVSCDEPNVIYPYGYIYMTTNITNNKRYIGKKEKPEFDETYFGSGYFISKIMEKHPEWLVCKPIDWAMDKSTLNEKEKWWIEFFDAVNSKEFYNILSGGDGGRLTGDSLQRMKESRKGKCTGKDNPNYGGISEKAKEKIRQANLGKHLSNETKEKIRRGNLGKTISDEAKEKMKQAQLGRHHSEEVKQKISKNRTGKGAGKDHWMHKIAEPKLSKGDKNFGKLNAKLIYCYNIKGVFQLDFQSKVVFSKYVGFSISKVNSYLLLNDNSENISYTLNGAIFSENPNYTVKNTIIDYEQYAKEKQRTSFLGKSMSEETKEKLRQAQLGRHPSDETREKISKNRRGKCVGKDNPNFEGKSTTEEQRKKHSEFMKEFMKTNEGSKKTQFSSESSSGGKNSQAKAVVKLTLDYQLITEYECLAYAAKDSSNPSDYIIRDCCNGKREQYKGHTYMFKSDYDQYLKEKQERGE